MKRPMPTMILTFVVALVWWPLVPIALVAPAAVRRLRSLALDRRRHRERVDALPDVVDLIMIAISSGVTITGSLRLVAERGPAAARPGFAVALEHLAAGGAIASALHRAADHLGPDYRSLLVTMAQAEREGSPLGALLIRLADEATNARRRRGERAARQLPVQMVLPLVLCSLPAVVLGAVVPLVLVSLRRL